MIYRVPVVMKGHIYVAADQPEKAMKIATSTNVEDICWDTKIQPTGYEEVEE